MTDQLIERSLVPRLGGSKRFAYVSCILTLNSPNDYDRGRINICILCVRAQRHRESKKCAPGHSHGKESDRKSNPGGLSPGPALFTASNILHQSHVRIVCPREKRSASLITLITIHRITSPIRVAPRRPLWLDRSDPGFPLRFSHLSL